MADKNTLPALESSSSKDARSSKKDAAYFVKPFAYQIPGESMTPRSSLSSQNSQYEAEIKRRDDQIHQLQEKLADMDKNYRSIYKKILKQLDNQRRDADIMNQVARNKAKQLETRLGELERRQHLKDKDRKDNMSVVNNLQKDNRALQVEINSLKRMHIDVQIEHASKLEALQSEIDHLKEDVKEKETQTIELQEISAQFLDLKNQVGTVLSNQRAQDVKSDQMLNMLQTLVTLNNREDEHVDEDADSEITNQENDHSLSSDELPIGNETQIDEDPDLIAEVPDSNNENERKRKHKKIDPPGREIWHP